MKEQHKLVQFATSKQFRKFSTVSLMYYCKRKKLLNCSLESWYKYLRLYGVDRKLKKLRKITYRNGLRARQVDEFWHIDITEIKFAQNKKAYLQIVVDNYSRMIVGWKVSLNKKMSLTYKTLVKSLKGIPIFRGCIVSDNGSENTGSVPSRLLIGRGIRQLIAKKDIKYSNSMVEAVFRQFKQKFLLEPIECFQSLYRLIYKFVHQYNNVIPHTMLLGATPKEAYKSEFSREEFIKKTNRAKQEAYKARKESYNECKSCFKKYQATT